VPTHSCDNIVQFIDFLLTSLVIDQPYVFRVFLPRNKGGIVVRAPFNVNNLALQIEDSKHYAFLYIPNFETVSLEGYSRKQVVFKGAPIDTRDSDTAPYLLRRLKTKDKL